MNGSVKKLSLFESATLRLTVWYMVLVMLLSLLFSFVLYEVATNEFSRALRPAPDNNSLQTFFDIDATSRQERIQDSTNRLIGSLVIFNLAVLVGGTALSYLLARRTLQPIKEAHDAQARFASDAAHELRTPLTVMQTEIEVGLRETKATAKQHRETLSSTLEEVARLRILTDRLLMLASQQDLPCGTVDMEMAVVEAVTHVVPLAQAKHIEIDNQVNAVKAEAHPESVIEVLGILLDNAIKYSPKKSRITLTSKEHAHTIEISVVDEGPGIAPEEQTRIFERFYRADSSRSKENVEGHGLGLSLAKRLVEQMRGHLTVQSDGKKGTIFTLSLPR